MRPCQGHVTSSILVFRSNCSHSIKALHYIGNVETQDRYPVRAPNRPLVQWTESRASNPEMGVRSSQGRPV